MIFLTSEKNTVSPVTICRRKFSLVTKNIGYLFATCCEVYVDFTSAIIDSWYIYCNKQISSWLVRLYNFYSLLLWRITNLFAAPTRSFVILHNPWIKIVWSHQPWSNLYIYLTSWKIAPKSTLSVTINWKMIDFYVIIIAIIVL